jgi:hypothetical protein
MMNAPTRKLRMEKTLRRGTSLTRRWTMGVAVRRWMKKIQVELNLISYLMLIRLEQSLWSLMEKRRKTRASNAENASKVDMRMFTVQSRWMRSSAATSVKLKIQIMRLCAALSLIISAKLVFKQVIQLKCAD